MDFSEPRVVRKTKKVRGKPFAKGISGNPEGKRKGTRNTATLVAESLLDGESESLTKKLIEMANEGNMAAMRLAIERVLPPRRERPLQFELPPLKTAADAMTALDRIVSGVANGGLNESEASTLVSLVHTFLEALGQVENKSRLAALENSISAVMTRLDDLKLWYPEETK